MNYKLSETQIADGWVLFADRFPHVNELQNGRTVNIMFYDGSTSQSQVNVKSRQVATTRSQPVAIAWQTPKPMFDKQEAFSAIPYGVDGLHAIRRNSDGFIRAWDIPGEASAQKIAEEYNRAARNSSNTGTPHERQV